MSHRTILLIEDNQDDCEAIVRGFKAVGLPSTIEWYQSTKSALNYLYEINNQVKRVKHPPNLVILDLNMPGTDGRKTLGIIKSLPKLKSIPVIIFTTSSDKRDVKQCYDSGANTYIQKPVNFEQMKKICSLLKDYWFNTAILPEDEPEDYMM